MKKVLGILIALIMAIALAACGQGPDEPAVKPSPEETTSQQANAPVISEINRCVLSPASEYYLTDQKMEYYKNAMDAIFSHKDYVKLTDSYDDNLHILGYLQDNPYTFILSDYRITSDHKGMEFKYAYSAKECQEIAEFIDSEYLKIINENITKDMSDLEKILAIYKYFSENISYDYDWLEEFELSEDQFMFPDITVYQALKTHKGVCHTYTYLCQFAFQQLGIKCERACADMTHGGSHMWPIIWLDNVPFHFDPTWDNGSLRYFGITDEENIERGMVNNWGCTIDMALDIECSDTRFQSWHDVESFELIGNHQMKVTQSDETTEIIDLTKYY